MAGQARPGQAPRGSNGAACAGHLARPPTCVGARCACATCSREARERGLGLLCLVRDSREELAATAAGRASGRGRRVEGGGEQVGAAPERPAALAAPVPACTHSPAALRSQQQSDQNDGLHGWAARSAGWRAGAGAGANIGACAQEPLSCSPVPARSARAPLTKAAGVLAKVGIDCARCALKRWGREAPLRPSQRVSDRHKCGAPRWWRHVEKRDRPASGRHRGANKDDSLRKGGREVAAGQA